MNISNWRLQDISEICTLHLECYVNISWIHLAKNELLFKMESNRHDAATLYWGKDCPWIPVLKWLLETQMYCVITEFWFTEWTIPILRQLCPFLVSLYSSSAFQYCLVDILATESFPNNLPFYKEKEARR